VSNYSLSGPERNQCLCSSATMVGLAGNGRSNENVLRLCVEDVLAFFGAKVNW